MHRCINVLFFALVVSASSLVALASAKPVTGEPVLVVSTLGQDAREQLVRQSGGRLIGFETAPLGTLAVSDHPDFILRLQQSGALMVLDGRQLAQLCGAVL